MTFASMFPSDIWLYFSFFCFIFVWLWYQGDGGFVEWVWEFSFLYIFLEEFEQDRCLFFSKLLVEFACEDIWP